MMDCARSPGESERNCEDTRQEELGRALPRAVGKEAI